MATQIVILNEDYIKIDDSFQIAWSEKGNAMPSLPSTIHAIIWNDLVGQNEIQNKDANGNMTGNTELTSASDAVGSTTISALLTWAETRKGQIEAAKAAYKKNKDDAIELHKITEGADQPEFTKVVNAEGKKWRDYAEGPTRYIGKEGYWQDYDPDYS